MGGSQTLDPLISAPAWALWAPACFHDTLCYLQVVSGLSSDPGSMAPTVVFGEPGNQQQAW